MLLLLVFVTLYTKIIFLKFSESVGHNLTQMQIKYMLFLSFKAHTTYSVPLTFRNLNMQYLLVERRGHESWAVFHVMWWTEYRSISYGFIFRSSPPNVFFKKGVQKIIVITYSHLLYLYNTVRKFWGKRAPKVLLLYNFKSF